MALFSSFFKVLVAIYAFVVLGSTASAIDTDLLTSREDKTASPFHLNIYNPQIRTFSGEFLNSSGHVTATTKTANLFKISGGLSTADKGMVTVYLSTSGEKKSMTWSMGPALLSIYGGVNLTTTEHGEVLTWENKAFDHGKARFCQKGSEVVIVFKGSMPRNCSVVDLLAYRNK